jgi:hypothetical protein
VSKYTESKHINTGGFYFNKCSTDPHDQHLDTQNYKISNEQSRMLILVLSVVTVVPPEMLLEITYKESKKNDKDIFSRAW